VKFFDINSRLSITKNRPFVIAGPCILESADTNSRIAESIKKICEKLDIDYIFKASFDKANRTSISSFRGNGVEEGLKELERIGKEFDLPLLTDIHESYHAALAAEVVDILQIPAFLCRQTDLLLAAAKTGKTVNIKKAQFLSADDMKNVVKKVEDGGNKKIMLTERGTMFGYNNLVVDFRGVVDMKNYGYPVIMDATHSTQRPGGAGNSSGGDPKYAPYLAKCAAICGADGFFFEVHPEPSKALSDAATMLRLDEFESTLREIKTVYDISR
jgi:2-dehydro-3-deoxyphosphooctonate aldolase (KDO 8-P synthase)